MSEEGERIMRNAIIGKSAEKIGRDEEKEERTNSNATTAPTTAAAAAASSPSAGLQRPMAKDPLDLGVPLPVLVARPEIDETSKAAASVAHPSTTARAAVANILDEATIVHGEDSAAGKEHHRRDEDQLAAGMGTTAIVEPGSYAIGGPGASAVPDPPDASRRDLEEGHDGQSTTTTPNTRINSSTGTSTTTTRLGLSSSQRSCSEVSSQYLVEARLVPDGFVDDYSESLTIAEAKPMQGQRRATTPLALCLGGCFLAIIVIVGTMVVLGFVFLSRGGGEDDTILMDGVMKVQPGPPSYITTTLSSPAPSSILTEEAETVAPTPRLSTLQTIRERGVLRCGVELQLADFLKEIATMQGQRNQTMLLSLATKFSRNYCQAIAAAVLGETEPTYELVTVPKKQTHSALANDLVDVFIGKDSMNMEQDIHVGSARGGISFATPYLYTGLEFLGRPFYVDCADDDIKTVAECSDISICLTENSNYAKELSLRIPLEDLNIHGNSFDLLKLFMNGTCNVIGSGAAEAVFAMIRAFGYQGELALGKKKHTFGLWALTALDNDQEWVDFLNALTMGLLAAEQAGISKDQAHTGRIGRTELFGDTFQDMFIHAIKVTGNMGDIYDLPIPRLGRNLPNNGTSGLLASPPLGNVDDPMHFHGRDIIQNGTIERILARGNLRCGIRGGRPGFAEYDQELRQWHGLDVDFCKAVAASLFNGKAIGTHFQDVSTSNGFVELHRAFIDVYAGAEWTLQNDIRETVTGAGYSFSQPYFYGPINDPRFDENLGLATRQDDPQFASFVYWTTQSLVYAEEHDIDQETSNEMPLIYVFGPTLQRMYRDAVHAMGSYKDVYQRNLASTGILPRGGRNVLNSLDDDLPFRYIPPGLPLIS